MRVAIDARAAAEVPAGRGRYVRELLRGLSLIEADHEYLLYARIPWTGAELDGRFRWRSIGAPGLSWPLLVGREMSRSAEVALACTSYAITAPWRIRGAAIVWDFAPFDRSLSPPRGSLLERLTLPIALRRCDALIAISQATSLELRERFPRAAGKLSVAHPGAGERFSPLAVTGDEAVLARYGVRRPFVLSTATIEPRKNLPRLIEAFTGLGSEARGAWTLALAGAPGWETDSTFAAAAAHRDTVQMLGYVRDEDLPALYRGAEVFAYPSLYEGFGIPVLEAMQSGTPVLTSSTSSMPEVGGAAARYADPGDVEDIRRGLGELLESAELRRRCASAGLVQATHFSWERTAREVLAVLERLGELGPRGSKPQPAAS